MRTNKKFLKNRIVKMRTRKPKKRVVSKIKSQSENKLNLQKFETKHKGTEAFFCVLWKHYAQTLNYAKKTFELYISRKKHKQLMSYKKKKQKYLFINLFKIQKKFKENTFIKF